MDCVVTCVCLPLFGCDIDFTMPTVSMPYLAIAIPLENELGSKSAFLAEWLVADWESLPWCGGRKRRAVWNTWIAQKREKGLWNCSERRRAFAVFKWVAFMRYSPQLSVSLSTWCVYQRAAISSQLSLCCLLVPARPWNDQYSVFPLLPIMA